MKKKYAALIVLLIVLSLSGCDFFLFFFPVSQEEAAEAMDLCFRTVFTAALVEGVEGTNLPGFHLENDEEDAVFENFELDELWDSVPYGYTKMNGTVRESGDDDVYDISLEGGPVMKIRFSMSSDVAAAYILDEDYEITVNANSKDFTLTEADKPD